MTNDKLWEKRALPALDKMYGIASNIFSSERVFTWDDITKYSYKRENSGRLMRMTPLYAFYLPYTDYNNIVESAVKGLRKYWHWPWRSEYIYSDEEIQRMQKELDQLKQTDPDNWYVQTLTDNIKYNKIHKEQERQWKSYQLERESLDRALEDGQITRKEYNKQRDKLCKSYDMTLRSADAEKIQFTLMDYSPNSNPENFNRMKALYEKLTDALGTNASQDAEAVSNAADKICNADGAERYTNDVIDSYMFYSNILNSKTDEDKE